MSPPPRDMGPASHASRKMLDHLPDTWRPSSAHREAWKCFPVRLDGRSGMEFVDRLLTCVDCGGEFVFTAGEQLFFLDKQFKNDPKRCKPCKSRRANVASAAPEQLGPRRRASRARRRARSARGVRRVDHGALQANRCRAAPCSAASASRISAGPLQEPGAEDPQHLWRRSAVPPLQRLFRSTAAISPHRIFLRMDHHPAV